MSIYIDDEALFAEAARVLEEVYTYLLPKERFGNLNRGPGWCGARGTSSEIEKDEVTILETLRNKLACSTLYLRTVIDNRTYVGCIIYGTVTFSNSVG